jgi:hypothetical protein
VGGWAGPKGGLDDVVKRKIPAPSRNQMQLSLMLSGISLNNESFQVVSAAYWKISLSCL